MDARISPEDLKNKALVEERLKAIASQLITAHRKKNHSLLLPYARQAGLAVEGQAPHHLFMKVIQVFHPDRLNVIGNQIDRALMTSDHRTLEGLVRLLEFHPETVVRPRVWAPAPDEDDFEDDFGADFESNFEDDWDPDEGTFYSVVKRALYGNLEFYPTPADLAKLGELDLSDWDLHDLEGIELCKSVTSLNLSSNNIDNVYLLKGLLKLESLDLADNDLEDADSLGSLVALKELDLSANDIDDVAFLDRLVALKYVDLTGNPIRNKAVIARLEARGVIVIL